MAKTKKSKSISKPTTLRKLEKISKPKQVNCKKSKPSQQPIRQSLRLKLMKNKKTLSYHFGTASPFLQSTILCHIFENNFSLFEQIEMRRVCRLWHYNVKHIWAKTRSLVLTLKDDEISDCESEPELDFEYEHFDTPTMVDKGVELTIEKDQWKCPTIDLLGELFGNIEHLTIFYEFDCLGKLPYFLGKFTKIKSFSLIMPRDGITINENFLSRLFKTIDDNIAPLHTLHIHLPEFKYNGPFPLVKNLKHLHKTLSYLQNFSLNCVVVNLGELLQLMGKSLPARWPMQSLSINVYDEKSLPSIKTIFEKNPKLSQIKQLQLTNVNNIGNNRARVDILLDHFTQVECLYLYNQPFEYYDLEFCLKWIKIVHKLPHLKELSLWNFRIQIFDDFDGKTFPNIRKLTHTSTFSFTPDIWRQYNKLHNIPNNEDVEAKLVYRQYLYSFARQFPNLEQLIIRDIYSGFPGYFSDYCFAEFRHLKSLRLIGRWSDLVDSRHD